MQRHKMMNASNCNVRRHIQGIFSLALPLFLFLFSRSAAHAQMGQSLVERLGYPAGTKLLILHADDLAAAQAIDQATFEALIAGAVSSASVMVPCPWLPDVARFSKGMPKADLGLHLTLTSEWRDVKWGPAAPRDSVSSLVDATGYFYDNCDEMAANARPEEVERELRAQIARAKAVGLQPTHFDAHMGCLHFTQLKFFEIYLKLGREYHVPLRLSRNLLKSLPDALQRAVVPGDLVIDQTYSATPDDYVKGMSQYYEKVLRGLQPGVNELVIHLARDGAEMRGVSFDHPDWGAAWRQADFEYFTSAACRNLLKEQGVHLITWREIGKLLK